MELHKVLYSKGDNDLCYTPDYGVAPILPFIPKGAVVWCPFDTADSEFVKQISKTNDVIYSHIDSGGDFLTFEPEDPWDMIVSNPPFKNKRKFFERALSFGKPFALLMTLTWLNDSGSKKVFTEAGRNMQLMMFNNRMKFLNNGEVQHKITFSTGYFCCDFLPRDIILGGDLDIPKKGSK